MLPRRQSERQSATDQKFDSVLEQVRVFAATRKGALPDRFGSDPDEARLGRWLAKQRWEAKHGLLPPHRARALSTTFPDWRYESQPEELFVALADECSQWVHVRGRFPRSSEGGEDETVRHVAGGGS